MSSAYYQDQLKLYWYEIIWPKVYEYDILHGGNCRCCTKILQDGNGKAKLNRNREKKRYI